MPTRPPMLYTRDALTILAESGGYRMSAQVFRSQMDAKGWSRLETSRALGALERRGWVSLESGTLHISDAGHEAAMSVAGMAQRKPRSRRKGRGKRVPGTRMPGGLF